VYGVPPDLNLQRLIGAILTQVAIGEFQIQFHFTPEVEIAVEGHWELRDLSGRIIDRAQANADREAYRIHQLLGHQVVRTRVDPPKSFALEFDDGRQLQVFDSSPQFESFTIQPGDVVV
jgi:Family of unknown function (DUF6188)